MSLKTRIQDAYPSFTQSEKIIADYFAGHDNEVLSCSAKELAEKIGTSAATIVRFARTLGYSGFPALKMDLVMDEKKTVPDLTQELEQGESITRLVQMSYTHRIGNLSSVRDLVDESAVMTVCRKIEEARNVYLCGIAGSGTVCDDFSQKLNRIGIPTLYAPDGHVQIAAIAGMQTNDVLIAVSYSGDTRAVLECAEEAKKRGGFVAGISHLGKTPLSRIADMMFYLPVQEATVRAGAIASRDASLFITDLIYLTLVSRDLDHARKMLTDTRSWVSRIR